MIRVRVGVAKNSRSVTGRKELIFMRYNKIPENFNPRFEIASCFIECDGKIILLQRHREKSQGGRWGLPAGKVQKGESIEKAVLREVREETGLDIPEEKISYFGKTFHHHGDYDFVFHMFSTTFGSLPKIRINTYEHKEFAWKSPTEILAMEKAEIVEDLDDVCKLFYNIHA